MRVDLERLRRVAKHVGFDGTPVVFGHELAALLAVVDAARAVHGCGESDCPLCAALEPFTPPEDRAWEEVDRWNAERDLAVKAAVDETKRGATHEWRTMLAGRENYERLANGPPPPDRDAIRDQLADAGVTVQRQFRSDQERIAELESYRKAAERKFRQLLGELKQADARLSRVPALVEALREADGFLADPAGGTIQSLNLAHSTLRAALAEWEKP